MWKCLTQLRSCNARQCLSKEIQSQSLPKRQFARFSSHSHVNIETILRKFDVNAQQVEFIRHKTVKTASKLVPELYQRLATSSTPLFHYTEADLESDNVQSPFWAFYWAGGQALTRWILDNPSLVKDKTILDFGCGSGAITWACLASNCKSVLANDIDEMALTSTILNLAEMSNLPSEWTSRLYLTSENLIETSLHEITPQPDIVFVGDMFYDSTMGNCILSWLNSLLVSQPSLQVYIGDPGRVSFRDLFNNQLKLMIEYPLVHENDETLIENDLWDLCKVWKLEPPKSRQSPISSTT